MTRFTITTTEPWETVAVLAGVLDFSEAPVTIESESTVIVTGHESIGPIIREALTV